MATHLVGATGNIGKRVVEKGGDKINAISRFELKLDQRPLYYNFDAKTIGGTAIKEGDVITIDGGRGKVMSGKVPTVKPNISGDFSKVMAWADQIR